MTADILSLGLMFAVYLHDRRAHYGEACRGTRLTARMLKIALPLAVSAYARSALTTLQNLLVPRGASLRRVLRRRGAVRLRHDTGVGAADNILPVVHHVRRGGAHRAGAHRGAGAAQRGGDTRRDAADVHPQREVFRAGGAVPLPVFRHAGAGNIQKATPRGITYASLPCSCR